MKRILFLMIAALCLIASCSKDAGWNPGQLTDDQLCKGRPVHVPEVVLPPNQDGDGNDTDDLLEAIENAAPGAVIRLKEGTYYLGYTEIYGFDGSISGAGQGKTIIQLIGQLEVMPQIDMNLMPAWIRIIGGNVNISDLTFRTFDGYLISDSDPWYGKMLTSLITVNNYNAYYMPDNPPFMNFTMKNVKMEGGYVPAGEGALGSDANSVMTFWMGTDVYYFLDTYHLTSGKFNIIDCYFDHSCDGWEAFSFGSDASLTCTGCTFDECIYGIYVTANYNSRLSIFRNRFINSMFADILAEDNDWGFLFDEKVFRPCEYYITSNTFTTLPNVASLTFKDNWVLSHPDQYQPISALAKGNAFFLAEGSTGISCLNSINAQVRNNQFRGKAGTGIYVDGSEVFDPITYESFGTPWAKNVTLLGNNLAGLESSVADIWLGPKSMNCTVVGLSGDTVIDEGTDNHVVGLKYMKPGHHKGMSLINEQTKLQQRRIRPEIH
jgi:hypothetical protein